MLQGKVSCWGRTHDQVNTIPQEVENENVKSVSVGVRHSCAITTKHDIFCWG